MQAYQSPQTPSCLYCGASWNPPGAETCAKCHNTLPPAQPIQYVGGLVQPGPAVVAPLANAGFYRASDRVALFTLLASMPYFIWWTFQLLRFAQRERFPKAASPWWMLVPVLGLINTYRAFKGLYGAEVAKFGQASMNLRLASAGYVLVLALVRLASNATGTTGLLLDGASFLVASGVLWMVQRAATRYQAAQHLELGPAPTGFGGGYSWGEIVALIVGVVYTFLILFADLFPA